MMQNEFFAYAAGFFDGEGCVDIRWRASKAANGRTYERFELRVCVPQVVLKPLEIFQSRWGGSLSKRKNGSCHNWVVTGLSASRFLADIRPWLIVKADEVDIALEFSKTMRSGVVNTKGSKGVDPIDAETRAIRREMHIAMRAARGAKGINGRPNAITAPEARVDYH